ncbi:MAG: recombinase zinc beta ribbon domain-containing protein, partial [Candidatus Rokubacteria bacterium]|nr:recombinase zinc beta ribbon domain-containing protein [Candidatus Rokubacteria bacterium]
MIRLLKLWLAFAVLLAVVLGGLVWRQRLPEPTVGLEPPRALLGQKTTLTLVITAPSGGLRSVEARLVQGDQERTILAERFEDAPAETRRPVTLEARELGLREGKAELRVWAEDAAWRPVPSREPRLAQTFTVDLTPPTVELRAATDYVRHGGTGIAIYRVKGAVRSGPSLVAGLLRCGRCGRRLQVAYSGRVARYTCRNQSAAGCGLAFGGLRVEAALEREVLRVLTPGAIEAALASTADVADETQAT